MLENIKQVLKSAQSAITEYGEAMIKNVLRKYLNKETHQASNIYLLAKNGYMGSYTADASLWHYKRGLGGP